MDSRLLANMRIGGGMSNGIFEYAVSGLEWFFNRW